MSSRVEGSKQNIKCWGQLEIHKSVGPVVEDYKRWCTDWRGGGLFAGPDYMLGLELCMCLRRTDVD